MKASTTAITLLLGAALSFSAGAQDTPPLIEYEAVGTGQQRPPTEVESPSTAMPEPEIMLDPSKKMFSTFVYETDKSYEVLTYPLVVTHIQLSDDEGLVGLYMGDTARWEVHSVAGTDVFIKPKIQGISTFAHLVTTKRKYPLYFLAGEAGDNYHYRIRWDYPTLVELETDATMKEIVSARVDEAIRDREEDEAAQQEEELTVAKVGLDFIDSAHTEYRFDGDRDVKPTMVMDDGSKKTYMLFSEMSELPTILAVAGDGELVLPNLTVRNGFIILDRVATEWVVRLGGDNGRLTRIDGRERERPKAVVPAIGGKR